MQLSTNFTLEELQGWMKENKESAFRAKQVFSWIYKDVWNFDDMKNIPGALKEKLKENFTNLGFPKYAEQHRKLPVADKTRKGNATEIILSEYIEECKEKKMI